MKHVASAVTLGTLAVLITACGGSSTDQARSKVTLSSSVLVGDAKSAALAPVEYKEVIQKMYMAFFGRPADPMGLAVWQEQFSANNLPSTITGLASAYRTNPAVKKMLDGFSGSQEAQNLYQGTNAAFVNAAYLNAFNRNAEPAGKTFWAGFLDRNELSRAEFVLILLQAGQNDDAIVGAKKIQAAVAFTDSLDDAYKILAYDGASVNAEARELFGTINRDTTITAFGGEIQSFVSRIVLAHGTYSFPETLYYAGFNHLQGLTDAPQYMARYRAGSQGFGQPPANGVLAYGEVPRTVEWTWSAGQLKYAAPITSAAAGLGPAYMPAVAMLCEPAASGGLATTDVLVDSYNSRLTNATQLAGKTFAVYRENCAVSGDAESVTFDSSGNGTFKYASGTTVVDAATLTAALNGHAMVDAAQGRSRLFNAYSYHRPDRTSGFVLLQRETGGAPSGSALSVWSEE